MPKILVVEDDADLREMLCAFLQGRGYPTVAASNGQEALSRLDDVPDLSLILLDLMMPVMSGWQFRALQRAHQRYGTLPVIALTAHHQANRESEWLGIDGVLAKPFSLDDMLTVVERHC